MTEPKPKKAMRKDQLQPGARRLAWMALETLSSIMRSEGPSPVRLAAAKEILDRGFGRPRVGDPLPARAQSEGFQVVVRQLTDERDDDPADVGEMQT